MNTRQSSKKEWTLERKNALMGYIMVSPILVGILLFTVVPVFFSLYISFTDWDMLHPQTWVGLQNYQTIFSDEMLGIVTKNTLVYCVIAIPGAILFGMLLALAILLGGLIVWKHRGNLKRILNGTESKFSLHHKKDEGAPKA